MGIRIEINGGTLLRHAWLDLEFLESDVFRLVASTVHDFDAVAGVTLKLQVLDLNAGTMTGNQDEVRHFALAVEGNTLAIQRKASQPCQVQQGPVLAAAFAAPNDLLVLSSPQC